MRLIVFSNAIKRNPDKFPKGYIIALTDSEKKEVATSCGNPKIKFSPTLPNAFTEKGLYMFATILKSELETATIASTKTLAAKQKNNSSMKRIYIFLSLILLTTVVFGQTQNLTRVQMVQDIDTLFSNIEKVHVNMYETCPKQHIEKDIETLKKKLATNGNALYFYTQVTPLVVNLEDGHTNVAFPFDALENVPNLALFPFHVHVTSPEKSVFVAENPVQPQNIIPVGAKIISINNREAKVYVEEMMKYVSAEKDFYKIELLEYFFTPLLYTLYQDSVFNIKYIYNGKKQTIKVKGISFKEKFEKLFQQSNSEADIPYTFTILQNSNIGVIDFKSFADIDKFKLFLDSTFQILQKNNIKNLIIDIRENSGGNSDLGDELLQYISPVPFAQFGKTIVKTSDIKKQFFKSHYNKNITKPNGIEVINEDTKLNELRDHNLRYKGNVYLLISHKTFSAAASFAWTFKYFKAGTVIGEETGGLAVCFSNNVTQKLPNSGLYFNTSCGKYYLYGTNENDKHGTLPDYNVKREKALEFTIELINGRNK
jgi:hypothetical protein